MYDIMKLRPFLKASTGIGRGHGKRKSKFSTQTATTQTTHQTTVSIPQAKTIAEANKLAVSLGLAQHAEFGKTDVSVANDMLASLAEHRSDFPKMPVLEFIGTMPEYRTYVQNTYGYRISNYKDYLAMSFDANKKIGRGTAIVLHAQNTLSKNILHLRDLVQTALTTHQLAVGSVKGLMNHEIGHRLEDFVGGRNDSILLSLYKQYRGKSTYSTDKNGNIVYTSKMAQALSEYANTNIREFIAESWAEYRTSSFPRPLARQVGERLEELYRRL